MIKQDFYIAKLIAAYMTGELTPEEANRLDTWRKEKTAHEALFQQIIDQKNLEKLLSEKTQDMETDGWKEVTKRIHRNEQLKIWQKICAYAAILLIPIAIIGTAYFPKKQSAITVPHSPVAAIQPGETKAILTLDNGMKLTVGRESLNELKQIDDMHIQIDSAAINYQSTAAMNEKIAYNTIETPRGCEYSLILSDGTKVYLNAMSSLRFPITFQGNTREVELIGEGYFEVNRNDKPFVVHTSHMRVQVLGTQFNISAYPQEDIQATLVSGSVKVETSNGESQVLKPNEQATLTEGEKKMDIRTVNAAFYTAWTQGKIHFKDQRLEDILKTLSRWYPIEVIYMDESIKDIRFGCHLNRYEEITPFIQMLEKTNKIKARFKEKNILLYNN